MFAWVAGGHVGSPLFQVSPRDPLVPGSVVVLLLVVSLVASGLPAWRASRVDAFEELKQGGGQRPLLNRKEGN